MDDTRITQVCSHVDELSRELEATAHPALDDLTAKVRDLWFFQYLWILGQTPARGKVLFGCGFEALELSWERMA